MSLAALRWLLPTPLYDAAGLAEPSQDPHAKPVGRAGGGWPIVNGPRSRALAARLHGVLPSGFVRCRGADYGDEPRVAATLRYRGPNGGYVRVLRRRLARPLLLDALIDPTHDGAVRVRASGTDVLHRDDDRASTHRLVVIRPNGTLVVIDSIGMPGLGVAAPLSSADLERIASAIDDASIDLASDEVDDEPPAAALG